MTTVGQQTCDALMKVFTDNEEKLGYLKGRWQDEKEYEDFEEYKAIMKPLFEAAGFRVLKITKSFSIQVTKDGMGFEMKIGTRQVSVKRFA